jgi:uncharacterized cofD-like protein
MRRWGGWTSHWKWLRPGMGVKRWLLLLVIGLTLLGFAVTGLPRVIELSGVWTALQRLHIPHLAPVAEIILLLVAGAAIVIASVFGMNRSLLSAFRRTSSSEVVDVVYRHRQRQRGPKVVAIGGGHGLNTLLRGLKEHTDNITAIVTVADDGGSSGRLRRDLGMLPPGDFRNCLAALSESEGLLSQLFQYRFGNDTDLEGHNFGNLYLTAMTAITGSFESALEESSRVLAVRGRVIPSTLAEVTLCAEIAIPEAAGYDLPHPRLSQVRGESNVGHSGGRIQRVYLDPEDPPAYPQAIRSILEADLIVIGPGSLYTSVLPNLLVPDLAWALASTEARKLYVCNVATQAGETEGYDVEAHVVALGSHVESPIFTVVLANSTFPAARAPGPGVDWVRPRRTPTTGYRLVLADLVDPQHPWRHDPEKLATAVMAMVDS